MVAVQPQANTPDRRAGRIAGRQHGVATYRQLLAAGLTAEAVKTRVRQGRLLRIHRGVYRVGHRAPSVEADYLAAVLACGPGACLEGRALAHLYGLLRGEAPPPEVAAPALRRVPGVVSRRRTVHPLDVTRHHGIPVLTIPALLVRLAGTLPLDELATACHVADARFGVRPPAIAAAAARRPGAPGAANLRAVIEGDHALLLSRLERRFRAALRSAGLPLPVTNRREGAHFVDGRWPGRALTVELDSYRWHATRKAWEGDHERRRAARARGDEFRRYTWADVVEDPAPMLAELAELLAD